MLLQVVWVNSFKNHGVFIVCVTGATGPVLHRQSQHRAAEGPCCVRDQQPRTHPY